MINSIVQQLQNHYYSVKEQCLRSLFALILPGKSVDEIVAMNPEIYWQEITPLHEALYCDGKLVGRIKGEIQDTLLHEPCS
jgi:hypothetical protein